MASGVNARGYRMFCPNVYRIVAYTLCVYWPNRQVTDPAIYIIITRIPSIGLSFRICVSLYITNSPFLGVPRLTMQSISSSSKAICALLFISTSALFAQAVEITLRAVVPADEILVDLSDEVAGITYIGVRDFAGPSLKGTFLEPGGSIRFTAPEGGWDWSRFVAVAVDIKNISDQGVTLIGDLDKSTSAVGFLHLLPRGEDTLVLYLMRKDPTEGTPFKDMNGVPGGRMKHWDVPGKVKSLNIRDLDGKAVGGTIEVVAVRGLGRFGVLSTRAGQSFFPFVDEFGQYKHEEWPGKVHNEEDLANHLYHEGGYLYENPEMPDRSQYGGWTKGPRLEATGHFRTEKHKGKWWLVDPEGYLFWSHGITGVGMGMESRITGRKNYFESLPARHTEDNQVDFYRANQERKYGKNWQVLTNDLAHRRLKSWGMNTIANWSLAEIYAMGRTPYVVAIGLGSKEAEWRKDPNVLREIVHKRMLEEYRTTAKDPWCIGYFVDNELRWQHVMDPEDYYRIVHEEVKRVAPNKLYMGSRLHGQKHPHGGPANVAIAASKYCDIIGINRYRFSPSDLSIPEGGVDKPIIIGEFHFGALDRGLVHTGLRGVGSQTQRAYAYYHYVSQALVHPNIVGTHWFQYRDQPITGRGDGENYQIGFVNIADNPYPEIVQSARWIGKNMYLLRSGDNNSSD